MQKTLKEIARLIQGEIVGDDSLVITGVSGIKEAGSGDITFLANPKYSPLINKTQASAIITSKDIKEASKPIIRTENPSLAFTKVISLFSPECASHPKGIHPQAIIGKGVILGNDAAVGAYAVIEDKAALGDRTVIYPGCYIGRETSIGSETIIYPNVSIRERTNIGKRVIIHSGTVIGSDGFGFVAIKDKQQKIPQIGTVEIGDDVEIGANVTIDRARFDRTIIGSGTKIDNLVQIAHNVVIGENSIIVAQAGISGSTTIGNNVTLAGQAGLVGHITIGDNAIVAAQAGVTKSVPANTTVSGYPAKPHDTAKHINACVQNLPKLYEQVKELKEKIIELEEKLKDKLQKDK
ncbi:MAG: UDP-3-O-(3-hydroxymyristoyl)glucosamine N-acyltransferase [Candidatus Omnitrophota bacterium]